METVTSLPTVSLAASAPESPTRMTEEVSPRPVPVAETVPLPVSSTSPDFTQRARASVAAMSLPLRSIVRSLSTTIVEVSATSSSSFTVSPPCAVATAEARSAKKVSLVVAPPSATWMTEALAPASLNLAV